MVTATTLIKSSVPQQQATQNHPEQRAVLDRVKWAAQPCHHRATSMMVSSALAGEPRPVQGNVADLFCRSTSSADRSAVIFKLSMFGQ